jgi:predicted protein tyrosine phosphatase
LNIESYSLCARAVSDWTVKSAGTEKNVVQKITPELLQWADKIVVMENKHSEKIIKLAPDIVSKVLVLGIEDKYYRNSPELIGRLIIQMSKRFQLDD